LKHIDEITAVDTLWLEEKELCGGRLAVSVKSRAMQARRPFEKEFNLERIDVDRKIGILYQDSR
jgi:hypothetical protein